MKLLNINVGIKLDNSEDIIKYIKQNDPDIVVMQEVVRPLEEKVPSQFRSKEALDRGLLDIYPYSFFGPLWVTDAIRVNGEPIINFQGHIEQGNQVLSKYKITEATNEHYYKTYSYALDWTNWEQEEHGRAVQVVELDIGGKPLQVLNLHGIWTKDKKGDKRTKKECEYIVKAAKRKNIPTIIAGDFNLKPDTSSIEVLDRNFLNLITKYKITSTRPSFKDEIDQGKNVVDYVFVTDDIHVTGFKVDDTDISDHLPLILEFGI